MSNKNVVANPVLSAEGEVYGKYIDIAAPAPKSEDKIISSASAFVTALASGNDEKIAATKARLEGSVASSGTLAYRGAKGRIKQAQGFLADQGYNLFA